MPVNYNQLSWPITHDMNQARLATVGSVLACLLAMPVHAQDQVDPITPFADIRYRLELVDQQGLPEDATASTLRVRVGLRTAAWNGLQAVVEGEGVLNLGPEHFNDTVNGNTAYPVVPDPQDVLLNQAYLRFQPVEAVTAAAGRQRIDLDNQRWIGSVGWRQNDQTFDSARVTVAPAEGVSLDYLHAWRVNRVFGPDSPQGIWRDSNINVLRTAYAIEGMGTVTAFGYWLDIPASPSASSRTLGVRLAGSRQVRPGLTLLFNAEYARQQDQAANPQDFVLDYVALEQGVTVGGATLKAGLERLEGNGATGLQTPLATLHAFNGWADKFLTTPASGLRDLYLDAGYRVPAGGPLPGLQLRAVWHDFAATRGGVAYANEWNALVSYPLARGVTATAKFAHYDAQNFATDTTKVWLMIEARF